jgi:hypothetical protein
MPPGRRTRGCHRDGPRCGASERVRLILLPTIGRMPTIERSDGEVAVWAADASPQLGDQVGIPGVPWVPR